MSSRDGLDIFENGSIFCRDRDWNSSTSSPYPSHYTDYANPAVPISKVHSLNPGQETGCFDPDFS